MSARAIRLKYLLQQRHWQTYRIFRTEYDKAARQIDRQLIGTWPSRAQFHRWLSGDLKGLPYADHCRTLELMFPGWSTEKLFELISEEQALTLRSGGRAVADDDLVGKDSQVANIDIFVDMTEEDNRIIAQRVRTAKRIFFVAHTGYNALVSQYQPAIRAAVANGCTVQIVVTDPDGSLMKEPDLTTRLCPSIRQENEIRDVLHTCGEHRSHAINSGHPANNVEAKIYKGVPTMNAFLVDGWLRVISYLPLVDAAECPVFEFTFNTEQPPPIVGKYLLSLERLWADSMPVELGRLSARHPATRRKHA